MTHHKWTLSIPAVLLCISCGNDHRSERDEIDELRRQLAAAEESRKAEAAPIRTQFDLVDIEARWEAQSRGFTALDGQIWVPTVRAVVKNTGSHDIDSVHFRAVFLDRNGIITSESREGVDSIPSGYSKGPVFIRGSAGYESDTAFLGMTGSNGEKNKWRFDLFSGDSHAGPWTKIRSGTIELPIELARLLGK